MADSCGAQRRGGDGAPLGQQPADVELTLDPALHADGHLVAVVRQCADVLIEVLRADDVEDDIARVLQLLGEILFLVVDEDIRPKLLARGELFRRPCSDGYLRTEVLGQLDRTRADATGAAVDEDPLPLVQPREHKHVGPYGTGHLRDRRCLGHRQALRHRHELPLRHDDVLGVATAGQQRDGGLIVDVATGLQAEDAGHTGRRGIVTLVLQDIAAVNTGGCHAHELLALAGFGGWRINQFELLGNCFHSDQAIVFFPLETWQSGRMHSP